MQYDSHRRQNQVHCIRISMVKDTLLIQATPVGQPANDNRIFCINRAPGLLAGSSDQLKK